jgi:methyltransferase
MVGGAIGGGTAWLVTLAGFVMVQRVTELWLARRNERWALERGAREVGRGHYPLFFVLHGGWLVGWIVEASLRGGSLSSLWSLWLGLFAAAEVLRYWAVAALGRRWNTRILVLEGVPPIAEGPYRYLSHPNYWAVALELVALPLVFGAWITAGVASCLNGILLLAIRIPAEEEALRQASAATPGPGTPSVR